MSILTFIAAFLIGLFGLAVSTGTTHLAGVAAMPLDTQADSGTTVPADSGQAVEVRLSHRWKWSEPTVSGPARAGVDSFEIEGSGYDDYLVQPSRSGTVVVHATGRPGPRRFILTIHVG